MKLRRTGTQKKGNFFFLSRLANDCHASQNPWREKDRSQTAAGTRAFESRGSAAAYRAEDRIWIYTDCHASKRTKTLGGKKDRSQTAAGTRAFRSRGAAAAYRAKINGRIGSGATKAEKKERDGPSRTAGENDNSSRTARVAVGALGNGRRRRRKNRRKKQAGNETTVQPDSLGKASGVWTAAGRLNDAP